MGILCGIGGKCPMSPKFPANFPVPRELTETGSQTTLCTAIISHNILKYNDI
jgi:hypothetical protein